MEVVEQPFRRRRHELSRPHIVGERSIGVAEHPRVLVEARKNIARAASGVGIDRERPCQRERPLFETLNGLGEDRTLRPGDLVKLVID